MQCPPIRYNGRVVKEEGKDPFKHPSVVEWHKYLFTKWSSEKKIALLLPCTEKKPYHNSPTHKIAESIVKDKVQIYSVSEPMLLVPREYEECYPFSDYDYPPSKMTPEERKEFVELLAIAIKAVSNFHEFMVAVLPRHHFRVLKEASDEAGVKVEIYPYGKLAFKSIKEASIKALRLYEDYSKA
ncbi:DUF5591 domain-containing protein [Stygiolobus caldivivus]|uniref:DUF5591 domain-containing protein n=1 Tax=Stygiolobus caldivivus TaxID=2824673 RepID=A0A8D5U8C2_9CREN|nr:DUF5591 domain-containing protein [Stygiolobus caldivivus]BCU71486.1 hypothetical protein KN1_27830 [Stygiolobus caldivivus]